MVKYIIYISVCFAFLASCKKAEDRQCFKSIGDMSSLDSTFSAYDTLRLYDDIDYELIPDSIFRVEIIGGENLVKHVSLILESNSLSITNENKCNFLRRIDEKIKVKIYGQDFNYIHYEGSESLRSYDTLHSDELRIFIRDGAGEVDLIVENGYTSAVVSHGWGSFKLSGETLYSYFNCNTNSRCDTRNLKTQYTISVNSNTQGDMYVNVNGVNQFIGAINQKGNIYYSGTPQSTNFSINDQGDIIQLD
tara:strand:- start:133346 stop:134092 length:747 start_codon:yes stop_codon:yes gene_type:complete